MKRSKKLKFSEKLLHVDPIRRLISKIFARKLSAKVNSNHYPAPFAVLDSFANVSPSNVKAAKKQETSCVADLATGHTAKNLLRVFTLQDKLKALGKKVKSEVKHVHVIGAGTMGGDIASYCALNGLEVTLEDSNTQAIANSLKRAQKSFQRKLKLEHLVNAAKDRLFPDVSGYGRKKADIIIEAIIENPEAKQKLFAQIEQTCKDGAILATNTSTIPLDVIGRDMQNKNNIIGVHFFNPVIRMPLVEVVIGEETPEELTDKALAFVTQIKKLPLPVANKPGFLVNRILLPYLIEAMLMYEEGISAELIDRAALEFGMPMGPIELIDTIGLDVCMSAAQGLGASVPNVVKDKVANGELGKKSSLGFYSYKKGKIQKSKTDYSISPPVDTADRLVMRLIKESLDCYRNEVVTEKDLVDAGMIFGAGFAPFLGGPLNYFADQGTTVSARSKVLHERYGDRFSKIESVDL